MKPECIHRSAGPMRPFTHPQKVRGGNSRNDNGGHTRPLSLIKAVAGLVQKIQVAVSVNKHPNTLHLRQP
jgi:hypothetical protein